MNKEYIYKASTSEVAIEKGLSELELNREDVEIEIIKEGGIFAKAEVKIIVKEKEEDVIEEDVVDVETEETSEEVVVSEEDKEKRFAIYKELREKGKEFLKEIARIIGVEITLESKIKEDEICFYVGGENARTFIGYKGETLDAIQTIVGQILNKDLEPHVRVVVDADFYRERRKKTLINLARRLAKQAYTQRREIALEPMNSYERRIIHSALQNSYEATTRSDGEGKDRHIVVVPKVAVMSYGNVSSDFRKKGPNRTKSFGYNKRKF